MREQQMKTDRTVGYSLLVVGLILIVSAVYLMVNVFTGAATPPAIFHMRSIMVTLPGAESEMELLPGAEISKIVNMGLWTILMFFVALAGSMIGGLGVKLAREIQVEVKRED